MSGGRAPSGLKAGAIGVPEVRMRVGTLLGKVTTLEVMVDVVVATSVISFVIGVSVTVVE